MFTIFSAISCEFFTLYVFGKGNKSRSFLFKCLANLCDGACVWFITGLIGAFSLCVLIYALSCGALGFIFMRYLCSFFNYEFTFL